VSDQKASISAMANKFQDDGAGSESEDDASSFEEIARPVKRMSFPVRPQQPHPPTPIVTQPTKRAVSPVKSPLAESPVVSRAEASPAPGPAMSTALEHSLEEIKQLLAHQSVIIGAQSDKISNQTQIINQLAGEVDTLKKKVGSGSQEQAERIRQLELELEAAKS